MCDVPLPSDPDTRIAPYADDTAVYPSSKSPALLCMHLQRYLDALAVRCRDWKVDEEQSYINLKKRVLFLVPKFLRREGSMVLSSEILGILIDNRFSWRPHVGSIVAEVKAVTKALYLHLVERVGFLCETNDNCICLKFS
ncbi:hypothetical protein Zmor_004523 [Zophobas morio]|jgi:hypothetical protein|uniref:Reverse transcriptase domain-containing protein n=1 Tax=Zophobas morio TaxID=2755281 RepID=A0AA38M080_9CUCU|nr:hypothetical protein Zmor_004523 [Zophobas morio]